MDSSGQISTESNLPPIDPRYSYKTFASIDISTPANDAGKQRLRKDSVFLAYPDGQEHPLIEDNLADAEAKSKPVLSERCCVVTDEAEHANFDSHDGFVVDEIAPFESNGLLEVPASPEGRFSSELSSEGRSGSSKRADLCPKFVLSESEPHGVVKSKFDGLGVELMVSYQWVSGFRPSHAHYVV
jgi:hypothetical protein